MKSIILTFILITLCLAACSSPDSESDVILLRVSDGTSEKTFSVSELEKMPITEATFNGVSYVGVALGALLEEAGFSPQDLSAVKASASDGYSVNYDPGLFLREDVIVAYATVDGVLSEDDGTFRMVLPGEEGKLNIRFLSEIQGIP